MCKKYEAEKTRINHTLFVVDEGSVYEHLVTTAACDQQLVPTTRSKDFILKYCRKLHGLLSHVFFSNFIIYFITVLGNPHRIP